ncbi:hypothetical protein OUZ56_017216 [Daphnia magna]|uniref:Uncharacterized protein n=1 Tax=Daphnia magna TaxID=35525 RepID=A0ABR0ASE9_9CRUS|nr:hypothetical protein OUZ56_017216 [Daphnia magna]
MIVLQVSKLYFSRGKRPQQNKRGSSVVANCDFTLNSGTVLKIIVHSQPGNPTDAAQTHDGAVAAPATAKEASVPASTSTHSVQREQTVLELMGTHVELDTSRDDISILSSASPSRESDT